MRGRPLSRCFLCCRQVLMLIRLCRAFVNSMEPKDQLRARLTPLQWEVTQNRDTEAPFTGTYWNHKDTGLYRCIVCQEQLFHSAEKFDSGCGWPAFSRPAVPEAVREAKDLSHGMLRTEVVCARCGAHLGHWFPDGPQQTRYCINSASLAFERS